MKQIKLYFLLTLLLLTNFIFPSSGPPPTTNITNNYYGPAGQGGTAQSNAETNNSITLQQRFDIFVSTAMNYYEKAKTEIPEYASTLWKEHKYKIIAGILCSAYVYICYQLNKVHTILKNRKSWCNWKQTVDIQHLISTPYQELIPQLLTDIQKKYLFDPNVYNPQKSYTTAPFEQFVTDIRAELNLLKQYVNIENVITNIYLSSLFFFSYKNDIIQEKISRLQIILDIFITWQTKDLLSK